MKTIKVLITVFICSFFTSIVAQKPIYESASVLQNLEDRDRVVLDGLWQTVIDPLENGYYSHRWKPKSNGFFKNRQLGDKTKLVEYNFDSDYQLMVPGDWNTQMEKLYYYEGTIWYKRSFDYAKKDGKKVFIHFGAVNYEAQVYLNGEKLGTHIGGFTPFQFDVTGKLKEKDNFLIVKVDNKRKREAIPTINTDWWNYGGITRSVNLVYVAENHIADYEVKYNPASKKNIEGWVVLSNKTKTQEVTVSIPELKKNVKVTAVNGLARFSLKAKPELWSPKNPKLYKVHISTNTDKVSDDIGFRTIETAGTKILLNGKPIFLKGISIHEEAPFKTGRVTSIEQCEILLDWAKDLGCNFVRLAHYPHNEEMVRLAEKKGLMIWSEIPVYWTVLFDNEDTYKNAETQLTEMITRDKNRAAIVLWSIANETPEGEDRIHFLSKLSKRVKELDDTRLVTAALDSQSGMENEIVIADELGKYVDVIGINSYCGWYQKAKPSDCASWKWKNEFNKPMIMSEVGAGALQGNHGPDNERWTEEYQDEVYKNNIEMMRNIDFLAGASPWILMDFRSHRRHLRKIQADFNRKGLISEQGVKKKAFYTLRDYYIKENK